MAAFPLTMQTVANEVLRLLIEMGVKAAPAEAHHRDQVMIAAKITEDDLRTPLDCLTERSLRPIAASLVKGIKGRAVKSGLAMPPGVSAAAKAEHGGLEVRAIREFDINVNVSVLRFDVLVV